MQRELAAANILIDRGCKNPNRLYFGCAAVSLETWASLGGARLLTGAPVHVDTMLGVALEEAEEEAALRARRPEPQPVQQQHRDKYIALARSASARSNMTSPAPTREAGLRPFYVRPTPLARLGLTDDQIADALLQSFVAAAGEHRRREGERAISDAVRARQGRGVG